MCGIKEAKNFLMACSENLTSRVKGDHRPLTSTDYHKRRPYVLYYNNNNKP